MNDLLWAGIGARNTPPSILADMTTLAGLMADAGWHLSSGGAHGADSAFAAGTPPGQRTLWLPWPRYNAISGPDSRVPTSDRMQECLAIAGRLHPAWHKCKDSVHKLHARNVAILLGPDLDRPVDAIVCFTEGGQVTGGTGMGLRIAAEHAIPVFNLGSMTMQAAWDGLQQLQRSLSAAHDRAANTPATVVQIDPNTMARVVHLRDAPRDAIRIDRRTAWGNPFRIGPDGTREEVIAKYRDNLWKRIHAGNIDLDALAALHGKDLACHCAPLPCHGDALAEAAAWVVSNKHRTTATMAGPTTILSHETASLQTSTRTYAANEACVFRFTKADWGLFGNFAPLPNPISAAGHTWATSEHLYQAAKFRQSPEVQTRIAGASTARDAAKLGRNRSNAPDADWMSRRVDAMRWAIRMKREANPALVDSTLQRTGDLPIVEYSGHDSFWGAKPKDATLFGQNILGRLWMELRQHIRDGDPRALASAWPDPLTPKTITITDPARAERTRINDRYIALLEAADQNPRLIPYQDGFDDFRTLVGSALDSGGQPAIYADKLVELGARLDADSRRRDLATALQKDIIDLQHQLAYLQQNASSPDTAATPPSPHLDAFINDCTACLDRWNALQTDPGIQPHIEHLNDPLLTTRIDLLATHVRYAPPDQAATVETASQTSLRAQHPIVHDYLQLLDGSDNKPELLAYQPGFQELCETVRLAKDSPHEHPDMREALGRLSVQLDRSHANRATVSNLRRRFLQCSSDALDLETWASDQSGRKIQDSPRYQAWKAETDKLLDEYQAMTRDSSLAPHLKDATEAREFFDASHRLPVRGTLRPPSQTGTGPATSPAHPTQSGGGAELQHDHVAPTEQS